MQFCYVSLQDQDYIRPYVTYYISFIDDIYNDKYPSATIAPDLSMTSIIGKFMFFKVFTDFYIKFGPILLIIIGNNLQFQNFNQ